MRVRVPVVRKVRVAVEQNGGSVCSTFFFLLARTLKNELRSKFSQLRLSRSGKPIWVRTSPRVVIVIPMRTGSISSLYGAEANAKANTNICLQPQIKKQSRTTNGPYQRIFLPGMSAGVFFFFLLLPIGPRRRCRRTGTSRSTRGGSPSRRLSAPCSSRKPGPPRRSTTSPHPGKRRLSGLSVPELF